MSIKGHLTVFLNHASYRKWSSLSQHHDVTYVNSACIFQPHLIYVCNDVLWGEKEEIILNGVYTQNPRCMFAYMHSIL